MLIILGCNKNKDILSSENTNIYKIAGNNYPKIIDFEFKNVHTYKKDSLYLNVGYIEFDSIPDKDTKYRQKKISENFYYLYVNKFEFGDSIPTEIGYYLNKNNEDNLFTYNEKYKGIPFHIKFEGLGKKIIVFVPYQIKLEQIENTEKVRKIETYSVYIDTVEVK